MTLDEAMKELSKSIKSALDIIGDAFRKIREVEEEPSKQSSDKRQKQAIGGMNATRKVVSSMRAYMLFKII